MRHYKVKILGLCETRWTGNDKKILSTGETFMFSCLTKEKASHSKGVVLMISKETDKTLIGCDAVRFSLITATFRITKKRW